MGVYDSNDVWVIHAKRFLTCWDYRLNVKKAGK